MRDYPPFFLSVEGITDAGYPITVEKAVFITRNSSTDYMTVMSMSYEEIDTLFNCLYDMIQREPK